MISPEPRLAAALELQIRASARPCTRVRSWSSRCCESIALPATNPRFQPQPSRNSASSRTMPPSAGAAAAISEAVASTTVPAKIVGTAPKRSVRPPGDRGQREHPERVRRQHDAHGGQVVPVLGHVERRHRHDQDHHELADDERDDRRRDARAAQDLPDRADAGARVVAGRQARGLVRELVRVGAEQGEGQDRGEADEHDRHEVRTGQLGQARLDREVAGDRDQRRPDHRADGRAPDHDADRGRPPIGRDHVAGRVARELVGAVAEADQERAGQQQRERARQHGRGGDQRAHHAEAVAGGEAGTPATAPGHEPRQQHGPHRGAEHDGRARQHPPAPATRASRCATIVATVTAAMCPVLPSATPATSTFRTRLPGGLELGTGGAVHEPDDTARAGGHAALGGPDARRRSARRRLSPGGPRRRRGGGTARAGRRRRGPAPATLRTAPPRTRRPGTGRSRAASGAASGTRPGPARAT